MYSLLSRLPTILDYIDTWWAGVCECGKDLDVSWLPDDTDHDGQWADSVWIATHCSECVWAAASDQLRPALRERYRRLRAQRVSLGLGRTVPLSAERGVIAPSDVARRSLGWNSGSITLYSGARRRTGKKDPDDLVIDQFLITGTITDARRDDLDPDTIASRPWFELGSIEPPDRPGASVAYARVLLGETVRDPKLPNLEWEYRWNDLIPASEGYFILPPDWQEHNYSPHQIGRFIEKAMEFYQARGEPGRPRMKSDRERYIDLSETFIEERERAPKSWEEFAAFVDERPSTLRDHLKHAGLWPWREFKADYFSERVIDRVLMKKSRNFP